eukprot:scaffold44427_cov229-Amphora_coffeaeformis.AAC.1
MPWTIVRYHPTANTTQRKQPISIRIAKENLARTMSATVPLPEQNPFSTKTAKEEGEIAPAVTAVSSF